MKRILSTLALGVLVSGAVCAQQAKTQKTSSQKLWKTAPAYLKGVNPFISYRFANVDPKKRNKAVDEKKLDTENLQGLTFGVGLEHDILKEFDSRLNLATRVSYNYGRDSQDTEIEGVNYETSVREHSFRISEAVQFGLENQYGTLRPTVELGLAYVRMSDTLEASYKGRSGDVEGSAGAFAFDIGAGVDFKLNNGLTPFAMLSYRRLEVDSKDVDVKSGGEFKGAKIDHDYELSGVAFNLGVGYTF